MVNPDMAMDRIKDLSFFFISKMVINVPVSERKNHATLPHSQVTVSHKWWKMDETVLLL